MADWGEITQAAGPSAVALAALAFATWQQRQRFVHERALGDRTELRELLDKAAQDLRKAKGIGGALGTQLVTHGKHITERAKETLDQFRLVGRDVDLNHDRLSIRLGTSAPLVNAHREALESVNELLQAVYQAGIGDSAVKDSWEAMKTGNARLGKARERFVDEAVALIGVDSD